jgi:hypothetical protein
MLGNRPEQERPKPYQSGVRMLKKPNFVGLATFFGTDEKEYK